MFGIMGLFVVAFAAAAIVDFYGQKQIDMAVESPIVLTGDLIEVSLIAGDGYNLYLVEVENKLNKEVPVGVTFSLLDGVGNELENTEGFYLAYSADIEYAYKAEYGNLDNWDDAKTWMLANLDWFDWYLTNDVSDYDASVMTNHGGNSAVANALTFNEVMNIGIPSGKYYAVVYLDISAGVVAGNYTLSIDMKPISN